MLKIYLTQRTLELAILHAYALRRKPVKQDSDPQSPIGISSNWQDQIFSKSYVCLFASLFLVKVVQSVQSCPLPRLK